MYKFHAFSVGVKWCDINHHVEKYGKQVLTVPADGMCFLTSVQMCMKHDLAIEYSIAEIKEKLLNEVIDDLEFYQSYNTGNKLKLVRDIFSYTNRNQFTLDVVDVVVNACANSLGINMYIFSRNGSEALLLPTFSRKQVPKNKSIFLKYDRFGGNIHSGDHYSPIVDCKLDQPNCANTCIVTNSPSVDLSHSHTNIANSPNKQLPLPTEPEQESTGINSNQLDSSLDVTLTVPSTQIMDEIMEACEEDDNDVFYDFYGCRIDVTQTEDTINVEQNTQTSHTRSEERIDLTNLHPKSTTNSTSTNTNPLHSNTQTSHTRSEERIDLTNLHPKSTTNSTSTNTNPLLSSTPVNSKQHNSQQKTVPTNETSDVEVVSSDNSEIEIPQDFQREDRPKKRKYAKAAKFNTAKFLTMKKEYVTHVPWDVDGRHYYVISTNSNQWLEAGKDGRWFQMHSSSRKGFKGIRKIGTCRGSLMCENTRCSKLRTEGVCNTNEFSMDLGAYVCKCCGYYAIRANCGASKMTEFDPEMNKLVVWYQGKHNCKPKPDIKKKEEFLKSLPVNDERIQKTHQQVQMDLLKVLIAEGNINKAVGLTRQMDDASLTEKLRYMAKKTSGIDTGQCEDNIEAFKNVYELKKATDMQDTNLIFAVNCKELSNNGEPSYVFKTSKYCLETAYKMDPTKMTVRGKPSLLASEPAYFDGMHRRCRGFKTLTLWTHHPGMRKMRRLATMEVERETQEMVAIFFRLFNEALAKFVGDPAYKFNPSIIMCDEAGANIQGVRQAFGPEFVERIATCQWHFKQCAWKQLIHIDDGDRNTFVEMVHKICSAMTVHEYRLAARSLEEICRRNKCVRWYNWWKARRYHIVPAFRGFGWTGTNWAEIGHSSLRRNKRVWLVTAAIEDVASAIIEHNQYISFVNNQGKTVGRGPTVLSKKLDERNKMRAYTNSAVDALLTGDVTQEINIDLEEDAMFIPRKSAKHRVPKVFATKNPTEKDCRSWKKRQRVPKVQKARKKTTHKESNMDEDVVQVPKRRKEITHEEYNMDEDDVSGDKPVTADEIDEGDEEDVRTRRVAETIESNPVEMGKKRLPKRKTRGKTRRYDSMVDVDESSDEELDKYENIPVPKEKEKMKLNKNPPTYVFLKDNVKRCQGCYQMFENFHRKAPHNLAFRYRTKRQFPDLGGSGEWMTSPKPSNCYYHSRDMSCLRYVDALESVEPKNLFIEEATWNKLTREHKKLMIRRKHLTHIRRTRAMAIRKS